MNATTTCAECGDRVNHSTERLRLTLAFGDRALCDDCQRDAADRANNGERPRPAEAYSRGG